MKRIFFPLVVILLVVVVAHLPSQEVSEMPRPVAPGSEHTWLKQFVGEWNSEAHIMMAPGQPPTIAQGKEVVRSVGELWVVGELNSVFVGQPFTGVMMFGYDTRKKQFISTWIDSMETHLWQYVGTLDKESNTLTMTTEGPNPMMPGQTAKFKEVFEFKTPDHRVLTSSVQGADGEWITMITVHYHRRK